MSNNQPRMSTAARVFMLSAFLLALSGCSNNDEDNAPNADDNENVAEETDMPTDSTDDNDDPVVTETQEQIADTARSFFVDVAEQGVDVERILELEGNTVRGLDNTEESSEDEVDEESSSSQEEPGDSESAETGEDEVMSKELREYFLDTYGGILDTYFSADTENYSDEELMSRVQTIINASLFVGGIDVSELYADEELAESGAYEQFEDLDQPIVEAEYADVDDENMTASIQVFPLDLFRSMESGLDSVGDDELIDIIVSEGGAPAQFVLNLENVDDQWWIVDDFGEPVF